MIELKDNQKRAIIMHDDAFYRCVINKDEKGDSNLVSYDKIDFVKIKDGQCSIDFQELNKTLESVYDYDISKSLKKVNHPYKYREFVGELMQQMYKLKSIEDVKDVVELFLNNENLEKELVEIVKDVDKKVRTEEKIFKEKIVPQVPSNWTYAMFPESNWSAYESNVRLAEFASGKTILNEDDMGISLSVIKYNYSAENRERAMLKYNGLNDKIQALNQKSAEV